MKKTNHEIINLNQAFLRVKNLKGVKFAYSVSRNTELLKPCLKALEEAIKESVEYANYNKERIELAKKHAKKDEKGKEIIIPAENGQSKYDVVSEEAFEKDFAVLKEKNKKVIEAREKQYEDYKKLLDEEVELSLFKIALEEVPADISTEQMAGIIDIIEETETKKK